MERVAANPRVCGRGFPLAWTGRSAAASAAFRADREAAVSRWRGL